MGVLTSRLKLLKPDRLETVDVVTGINNNYDRLDLYGAGPFICTSTTRPASGDRYNGLTIFETDTKELLFWDSDAAAWQGIKSKHIGNSETGFPVAASAATAETVVDRKVVGARGFVHGVAIAAHVYATYTQAEALDATLYWNNTEIGRVRKKWTVAGNPEFLTVVGNVVGIPATTVSTIELRVSRATGTGTFTTSASSSLTRMSVVSTPG